MRSLTTLSVIHILSSCLMAQPSDRTNWNLLQTLDSTAQLQLQMNDAKEVRGRFSNWSPSSIELMLKAGNLHKANAADVKSVWVRKKGSRWKSAAIAGAVGFGVGFAFGASQARNLADRNNPSLGVRAGFGAGFGLFGGGIGAGLGALTGGRRYETVYRRR